MSTKPQMDATTGEFRDLEQRLGEGGRLGLSGRLIAPAGQVRARIEYRSGEWFPMASVVKVPIGLALELMSRRGDISLDEEQTITFFSACPGPWKNPLDKLFFIPWSAKCLVTYRHLLNVMLADSDNTAADAILVKLGGPGTVQTCLADLGIKQISIKSTIDELLSHYYDLPPKPQRQAVPARVLFLLETILKLRSPWSCRSEKESEMVASGGRSDSCTPAAMTELLCIASSDPRFIEARNAMKACKIGKARIPRGLKAIRSRRWQGSCLYHKTGTLGGIANDVGFVVGNDESRIVLSIFTRGASSSLATRETVIARAAERTIATLECMATFPPVAFREAFALKSLVKNVCGQRDSLLEYCGRPQRGIRSLQARNRAELRTDEPPPRKIENRP